MMEIRRCNSMDDVATAGANYIEARAKEAVSARGQFTIALSGGSTPWIMLRKLAGYDLPWQQMKIFHTDERVALDGDSDRNLTRIREDFADRVALPPENLLAMPVTSDDLDQAAAEYEKLLVEVAGESPVLDVVHLGLGGDGHTASLVPDDPVLEVSDRDVAPTDTHAGRRRMTLTYPIINRARHILWLITGVGKVDVLSRLLQSDRGIPAGRVSQQQATVVADSAALPRQPKD
jgi:6-phosphogluconolactonase